jgi:hypothetical protein
MSELDVIDDVEEAAIEDENVEDPAALEPSSPIIYGISSYGADYSVDLLVKRMRNKAFVTPPFQRSFVWSQPKASRFIESLLLGLPVPSIFLYKEEETGKHLIVDGQQRLKSLEFFYEGKFDNSRIFRLQEVQDRWKNKTYEELTESDRQSLDDAIIHTIIFKQDVPQNDKTSIYHVFERLNTGGLKLYPQEIRHCVNHGPIVQLLERLNQNAAWREIYGPVNRRLKDKELILRFLALFFSREYYRRPMVEFLNKFMEFHKLLSTPEASKFEGTFVETIENALSLLGPRAFRPERALNAAVYDAVMVGLADRLQRAEQVNAEKFRTKYDELLHNSEFKDAYLRSTADEESMAQRIRLATEAFAET